MGTPHADPAELDLSTFTTEAVDPRYANLDQMSVLEVATAMNEAEMEVPRAVNRSLHEISAAITAIVGQLGNGGRMFYVGAGTPGRLGILDASECPPTFSTDPEMVQGIIAGGPSAIINAVEGAEDDYDAGRGLIEQYSITAGDVVVGVTASGRTPFVIGAVDAARELGAVTVGVSSNANAELSVAAQFPIEVVVGPEIVSGSTRLKAGSAQKQVLNMLSTVTMVQLGKTYGNLMVDVSTTNAKLRVRARNLVQRVTGASEEVASEALARGEGHVKIASVMILRSVDAQEAKALLAEAHGNLRAVLEA